MNNLKLSPIIGQMETFYYKTGKVKSKYLKPLTQDQFVVNNTQHFSLIINNAPISEDEEHASYRTPYILFMRKYMYTRN